MRAAFIVSAVIHFSILFAAFVTLPDAESFATEPVAALPVELVSIEELTDITEGDVQSETVVEDAAPETVEAPEPPAPEEAPGATDTPDESIATEEDARANAPESSAPEPTAAPPEVTEPAEPTEVVETPPPAPEAPPVEAEPQEAPPEEAVAEAEAEELPQETEVAAIDPQSAPEAEAAPPPPVPETVVPTRKPKPPQRTQPARVERASEEAFNADRLSQLINRTDPTGGGSGSAQASLGSEAGRAGAELTLSEKDALRSQMQRCWNPPIGLANGQDLVIAVQIRLAPDGSVENIEQVGASGLGPLYDVAADAARRAVLQCQPYRLPTSKYDAWKDVQVTFDPRDLF